MPSGLYSLTAREREVLGLISDKGYSNKDIAGELVITVKTVGNHVSNILGNVPYLYSSYV